MICLIGAADVPKPGPLSRARHFFTGYAGVRIQPIRVLGLRGVYAEVERPTGMGAGAANRRLRRAAVRLRAAGADKALFAGDFPYRQELLREGFSEMDGAGLMEALAGRVAARLSGGGGRYAAFYAPRLTEPAARALTELCGAYRNVMTVTGARYGATARALAGRLGVSLVEEPSAAALLRAETAVFFGAPPGRVVLDGDCVAVAARAGALATVVHKRAVTGLTLGLQEAQAGAIPEGFAPEPLFAAALAAGTLRPSDIELRDVAVSRCCGGCAAPL